MRGTEPMRNTGHSLRSAGLALLLLLAGSAWLRAATVMVCDVDVRRLAVGATVELPVQISGVVPDSFGAFVLDFAYDTAGLRWEGVSRGEMLAATGSTTSPYTPYLWALEASHDAATGRLRVAGMILGDDPGDNTPAGMAAARVPSSAGVLLKLQFTLLATDAASVELVTGTADGRCALVCDDDVAEPTDDCLVDGGVIVDGTPNWWALDHFGDPEWDPDRDDDGDWRTNAREYEEDTDPTVIDQRLSFQPGWNLLGFCVLPTESPADWVAGVNAAQSRERSDLLSGTVYYFDPLTLRYTVPTAFEAGKAYWFYAFSAGDVQFQGTPVPTDYTLSDEFGWQPVALPERLSLTDLGTDTDHCVGWNAGTQENEAVGTAVEPISGYWLYRPQRR